MMLRSSSTPVLGSLLSDCPNNNIHHQSELPHTTTKHPPTTTYNNHKKFSCHLYGSSSLPTLSSNSSPISPSINGFRRAQSEGNLEGLANASCNVNESCFSNSSKKYSRRPNGAFLDTIPSFSVHNSLRIYEDEDSDEEEEEEESEQLEENVELNAIRGESSVEARKIGEIILMKKMNTRLNEEMKYANGYGNVGVEEREQVISPNMYLARGLGVTGIDIDFGCGPNGGGGGGGRDFTPVTFCGDDGDGRGLEDHFKRMVEENPGNPLFLRNYAQFLYHSKGDLEGAEEYYGRAILADPRDGEIVSQYAKLVWELHRDCERATRYFERAVEAASQDSHIHAAYASFLWETEEDVEEDDVLVEPHVSQLFHKEAIASVAA